MLKSFFTIAHQSEIIGLQQQSPQSICYKEEEWHKTQDEFNAQLVSFALEDKRVVRLKVMEIHLFGRAAEELRYAALFNIETAVIPGISSYAGIAAQHQIHHPRSQ